MHALALSIVALELPRDDEDPDTLTVGRALDPVAYARLWGARSATALPPRLVLSPRVGLRDVPGGTLAVGYSRYEPTLLSADLLAVLRELRADETVAGFRARMLADEEVDVPEELLVALYRQRIVEEPASAGRVAEDVRDT